jgi:arylsulfatase A-like enzyme
VFKKAYPESLPTIPVRRSIHTGIRTFPFNHKLPELRTDDIVKTPGWQPIPPHQTHLAEYLASKGFITAFITSTYHQFKPNMNFHLGFHQWNWIRGHEDDKLRVNYRGGINRLKEKMNEHIVKKDRYASVYQKYILKPYFSNIQGREKEEDYYPAQTFTKAVEFIKDTKERDNIFALIDEFDPHEPWDPPQKYLDLYIDKSYRGKKIIQPAYRADISYLTEEELNYMRACYAGEVSLCDNWFGYFIEELKSEELYEESLIILTSDHGHSIGEHNATGKLPRFLYPELVDIPFIIKPPSGIKGSKRIEKSYIYNHDILPTIFGYLKKEIPNACEGMDLSIFSEDNDQLLKNRDYITCGFSLYTLYKDDHYALITSNNHLDQKLFDLRKDPGWNNNISNDNPDICKDLFKKIEKDAKGGLILEAETALDDLQNWYMQKKNSDN